MSGKGHSIYLILAFSGTAISFLWYLGNLLQFGFGFDQVDFLGLFFLLNLIFLSIALFRSEKSSEAGFWSATWIFINTIMTLLFLRQFLALFDPFYNIKAQTFPYLLRGLFLMSSLMILLYIKPWQYFRFPTWLLILVGCISIFWIFVYAAPSVVREICSTGSIDVSDISGKPGDKIMTFNRKNPERRIQRMATYIAVLAWIVLFTTGMFRRRTKQGTIALDSRVNDKSEQPETPF